jgi:hypothetical protein
MQTGPSVTASAPASMTDAERANALGELARLRAGGALTLGELAEAARRVHAGRTSSELEQAGRVASGGTIAAQALRRWLVVFLGGYSQQGRWRLGSGLRLVSVSRWR